MAEGLIVTRRNRRLLRLLLSVGAYSRRGVYVARGSKLLAAEVCIGHGTRINGPAVAKGSGGLSIGRYCAIGHDVKFITSNHSTRVLNLNLALQRRLEADRHVDEERMGIRVRHNVWIGDSAILLPGVEVGNGAVIGAGTVVTRSVPAFGICVGNPGRVIRKRIGPGAIEVLEASRWWEKEPTELERYAEAFDVKDVDANLAALRRILGTASGSVEGGGEHAC